MPDGTVPEGTVPDGTGAVIAERARAGDGRGYFRRRVHWADDWLAAQDRAVLRIAEPDHAVRTNGDAVYTLGPDKRPIRTADVFKYPIVLFMPKGRVMPRHPHVGQGDVRARIPA